MIKSLCIISLFFISTVFATINGKYRVSDYKINTEGGFTYDVTIKVLNDLTTNDTLTLNWQMYTDDTTSLYSTNIEWIGGFEYFEIEDTYDPEIIRKGYQRQGIVICPPNIEYTYRLNYTGSSEYWSYGGGEGTFYGDGAGGADTNFEDFYVNITFPETATNFEVIEESSPHIILSETPPIKLRWIEHDVYTIRDNVKFWGEELTTENPNIIIEAVTPLEPSLNDLIIFNGKVEFPNGEAYLPIIGEFGVEDPLYQQTRIIEVDENGYFTLETQNTTGQTEGLHYFRFVLNYSDKIIQTNFVIALQNDLAYYDYMHNVCEVELYSNPNNMTAFTNALSTRSIATPSPLVKDILHVGYDNMRNQLNAGLMVWKDYWSSDVNKGVFVTTGVACISTAVVPNPITGTACAIGAKIVGVGLAKSAFFVVVDNIIDSIPSEQMSTNDKEILKVLYKTATHTITFVLNPGDGGIETFVSAAETIAVLQEIKIKSASLKETLINNTGDINGAIFQCVEENGDVWSFGVGELNQNNTTITSYSPVDLVFMDPHGMIVSKDLVQIINAQYMEDDFNGDGDLDDRIIIPNYILGEYQIEVVAEEYATPTDLVSLTLIGSWTDSVTYLAKDESVENITNTQYVFNTEPKKMKAKFWFESDTLFSNAKNILSYLELPTGYDYNKISRQNIVLNENITPSFLDTSFFDSDSNGISELMFSFNSDSLLKNKLNNDSLLQYILILKYDTLNIFLGNDSLFHTFPITSIEKNNFPTKYDLLQNYPNPFNPATTIKYSLPSTENVKLLIFNALGKKVATLVKEKQESGSYAIKVSLPNMASGVYFYHITAGSFKQVKKMLLIK